MRQRQTTIIYIPVLFLTAILLAASTTASAKPTGEAHVQETKVLGLTWKQATEQMERRNPLMKAARAGLDVFRAKLGQARWAYFPKFSLDAALAPTPRISGTALETVVDFDRWGVWLTAKIIMVQPIYTFGKVAALSRAAEHGVAIGQALVEAARLELRYRLAQAWYGMQLASELKHILGEGKKWLNRAEKKMASQRKADSDDYKQNEHLRLKTRVSEFFAMEAENNELEVQAEEGLRLLIQGMPKVKSGVAPLQPISVRLGEAEDYWALAKKSEPRLQVTRATERAKGALSDHKAAKLWPDLVVVGEASTSYSDVVDVQQSTLTGGSYNASTAAALLALRWHLDIPTLVGQLDEARAMSRKSSHEAQVKENTLELKVRTLYRRLKNKQKLIGVYSRSQKAAQGWLLSAWELYDDGFGEFRMVMEALVQFYGKKVAYLRTVFEFNVLVHEFSQAVGVDITTLRLGASRNSGSGLSSNR